jgi:hypothetical protein
MGQRLNLERFHQVILFGAIFPQIMRDYLLFKNSTIYDLAIYLFNP